MAFRFQLGTSLVSCRFPASLPVNGPLTKSKFSHLVGHPRAARATFRHQRTIRQSLLELIVYALFGTRLHCECTENVNFVRFCAALKPALGTASACVNQSAATLLRGDTTVTVALRPSESDGDILENLPRTAALVALESDDLQLVSLLLNVLGWQYIVAEDFNAVPASGFHLILIGRPALTAFLNVRANLPAGLVSGVTIDQNDQQFLEIAVKAKVTCLIRPLGIADLESLITSAN